MCVFLFKLESAGYQNFFVASLAQLLVICNFKTLFYAIVNLLSFCNDFCFILWSFPNGITYCFQNVERTNMFILNHKFMFHLFFFAIEKQIIKFCKMQMPLKA